MLMCCCLCGAKLNDQSPCLLDTSMFGSNYTTILYQLLEENEKNLICVLDSGSICVTCAAILESVEMCLNKLRDLKDGIINSYKTYITTQYNQASQQQQKFNQNKELEQTKEPVEHEYKLIDGKSVDDNIEYRTEGISCNEPFSTQQRFTNSEEGFQQDYIDDSNSLDSNSHMVEEVYETSSLSSENETVQVFDFVVEDPPNPLEMQTLELDLDEFNWNSMFDRSHEGTILLKQKFDDWKPKMIEIIKEYVKICDIDLMTVEKSEDYPMFMGYCRFSNCNRTIQIRIIEVRKLEFKYTVDSCISDRSTVSGPEPTDSVSTKKCEYCLKQFHCSDPSTEKESIKNHLRVCHSQTRDQIFTCKCGRRFNKKSARNSHLKRCESVTDVDNPILTCDTCNQQFNGIGKLQRHSKTCKPVILCQICKKEFGSSSTLEKHMITIHQTPFSSERRKYPCDKCEKVFWKKYNLESHSLMHSDLKPFKCEVEGCNKRFKREVTLRQHISTRHENRSVTLFCALCTAQFKSAGGLKLHIETTHNMGPGRPRKYPCDKCDKRFKCEADLTLHNVTHTKEKNYSCNLCELRFSRSNSLKEHMNVHSQTFMCKGCYKCFGRDRYLQSHMKICPQVTLSTTASNESEKEIISDRLLCQIVEEDKQLILEPTKIIQVEESEVIMSCEPPDDKQWIKSEGNILISSEQNSQPVYMKNINCTDEELSLDPKLESIKEQNKSSQIKINSPSVKKLERGGRMRLMEMNSVPKQKILNLNVSNAAFKYK